MKTIAQDKIRAALRRLIEDRGADMASVSRAIGKNHAYIQQYLTRGVPNELGYKTALALADYFGCGADVFGIGAVPATGNTTPFMRPSNDHHNTTPARHPLQSIRRLVGLDVAQMAKALNEPEETLHAIERGQTPLSEKLLLKICRTFQIEPEDLSGYAPAMSPEERVMLLRFRQLDARQRQALETLLNSFEKERA